jgi:3-oxoacyl-[acyl-carrier protein] reductase
MKSTDLTGKVAVVTGAGRGIGRFIATTLAAAGMDVAVCSRTTAELDSLADEIRALDRDVLALPVDVADWEQVSGFVAAVRERFGRIDRLVNNAGGSFEPGPLADSDPAGWRQTVEINLFGTYNMIHAALPHIPAGGQIINISSGQGLEANPNDAAYNAAKAAQTMLTRCLSLEIWDREILVNDVNPGLTATPGVHWSEHADVDAIVTEFETREAPWGPSERVKHPREVADLVLQVAGYDAGGPTGQFFSLARHPL